MELEEEKEKEELPLLYQEGREIDIKLTSYRTDKEEVIKALCFLSHLISDIDGKLEEVRRCMYGDRRLATTHIQLPRFFFANLVISDDDIKQIKNHVTWYYQLIKEERFGEAVTALTDLKKILTDLKDKKTRTFAVLFENTEAKAHTPIVIAKKKK